MTHRPHHLEDGSISDNGWGALAIVCVIYHVEAFLRGGRIPTPRSALDALCAALHGPWQRTSGMAVLAQGLPLAQRTRAGWGMATGICSGSIAEDFHPSLQKRA